MAGLGTESNRLIAAVNTYDNTLRVALEELFLDLGLTEPINLPQIQALTSKNWGQLLEGLGDTLKTLGMEIGSRSFEQNLSDMGYADVDAAIADAPNHFSGNTLTEIVNTLTRIKADLAFIDAILSPPLMLSLVAMASDVKDRNKETALNTHNVNV